MSAHRNLTEKGRHPVDVLRQKVVEGEHIRFLCTEKDIVGEILDNFGNQKQTTPHILRRRSRYQAFDFWRDDCRAKKAEEYESADCSVFGLLESR